MYLKRTQISFYIEKNLDLHLTKMQIHFYLKIIIKKKLISTSKKDVDLFLF